MASHWIIHTALIVWIYATIYVQVQAALGQGQIPVGASRVYRKTSFTCSDRPAGYYADMETGCQVYHMCDGLGRQFSYSCPNTTLFQQRMLICDHWYMVNCSRAGADYSANLLIGQRDKPFVPDDENQQRTPRPDLLDRPYAPDYSGESFRNQYKDLPPIHNHITDSENDRDFLKPLPTRWSLRNSLKTKDKPIYSNRRSDDINDNDLGTSFSSNYNTSRDVATETNKIYKTTDSNTITKSKRPLKVKTPSKIYEPPFINPIYNEKSTTTETPSTKRTEQITPTEQFPITFAGQIREPSTTSVFLTNTITENRQKPTHQTVKFSKFLEQSTTNSKVTEDSTSPITTKATAEYQTESNYNAGSALDFDVPLKNRTPFTLPEASYKSDIPTPARDLLPPFLEYVVHDVATTEGPPIYYEWKDPLDSLEPPKFDYQNGLDSKTSESDTATDSNQFPLFTNNPFLSTLLRTKNSSAQKSATARSIQSKDSSSSEEGRDIFSVSREAPSDAKIEELQREHLVPDFLFPLETDTRTGYELEDTLNSFRLKIARKRNVNRQRCAGCRLT